MIAVPKYLKRNESGKTKNKGEHIEGMNEKILNAGGRFYKCAGRSFGRPRKNGNQDETDIHSSSYSFI